MAKYLLSHIQGLVFNPQHQNSWNKLVFNPFLISSVRCWKLLSPTSRSHSRVFCAVFCFPASGPCLVSEEPAQSANSATWKCRESVPTGADVLIPSLLWAFLGWTRVIARILKVRDIQRMCGLPGRDPRLSQAIRRNLLPKKGNR